MRSGTADRAASRREHHETDHALDRRQAVGGRCRTARDGLRPGHGAPDRCGRLCHRERGRRGGRRSPQGVRRMAIHLLGHTHRGVLRPSGLALLSRRRPGRRGDVRTWQGRGGRGRRGGPRSRSGRIRLRYSPVAQGRVQRGRLHTVSTCTPSGSHWASWRASRRSTSRPWSRCGCSPWRSRAATRSC